MCLEPEWFEAEDERKKKWDTEGLSIQEAEEALACFNSTVYPIGVEMAEYIIGNRTAKQVARLDPESRNILFAIYDEEKSKIE